MDNLTFLLSRIGDDWLGKHGKVMELMLLLEAWWNKDEFIKDKLCVFDKFILYFIHTFS